jgi:6-phospho-3-hexuloisomerase
MTSASAYARSAVAELAAMVSEVVPGQLETMVEAWAGAPRLFFTGVGRSGLAAKAVAMRLMHIGRTAYVVGEIATPAIGEGDLLVAVSSSGRGSILEQARTAAGLGARIAAITSSPANELAALAAAVLVLPARTRVSTEQHAGSLFEQSVLVLGDAVCRGVQARLGVASGELDARHANLM